MRLSLLSLVGILSPSLAQSEPYKAHNFSTPLDHFHNETRYAPHSNASITLRYWFDSTHYEPGGPVFIIAAGETNGEERFPFLSQGIVTNLAREYQGLGVILEHRYYGESYPDTNNGDEGDISIEEMRFLSTEQSLADHAHFASNIVFPGLEEYDLTAPNTKWIAYGGSYAGAQVAFMRKIYPEVFTGAVSSSGVTAAIVDFWEYYEPIRNFAPGDCIESIQTITDVLDKVFMNYPDDKELHAQVQSAYGLSTPIDNVDFVNTLSSPLGSFQSRNWDPNVGSYEFRHFCDNITHPGALYKATNATAFLPRILEKAGYNKSDRGLLDALRNHIGYLNLTSTFESESESGMIAESGALTKSSGTSWSYQVCTEWGYFMPGSTVPNDIKPLISRLIDLNYTSSFCNSTFGIDTPPAVENINKHGGLDFSFPRVAIIGGTADPWRDATPHRQGLEPRESSNEEPFILIDVDPEHVWDGIRGAVHHWDQNGLMGNETEVEVPVEIVDVQREIVRFVGVWIEGGKEDL